MCRIPSCQNNQNCTMQLCPSRTQTQLFEDSLPLPFPNVITKKTFLNTSGFRDCQSWREIDSVNVFVPKACCVCQDDVLCNIRSCLHTLVLSFILGCCLFLITEAHCDLTFSMVPIIVDYCQPTVTVYLLVLTPWLQITLLCTDRIISRLWIWIYPVHVPCAEKCGRYSILMMINSWRSSGTRLRERVFKNLFQIWMRFAVYWRCFSEHPSGFISCWVVEIPWLLT